jgi:hypothetical protein
MHLFFGVNDIDCTIHRLLMGEERGEEEELEFWWRVRV